MSMCQSYLTIPGWIIRILFQFKRLDGSDNLLLFLAIKEFAAHTIMHWVNMLIYMSTYNQSQFHLQILISFLIDFTEKCVNLKKHCFWNV